MRPLTPPNRPASVVGMATTGDPVLQVLMRPPEPDDLLPDGQRRCKAIASNSGERCKRGVTPGALVCGTHGGRAPQVKAKARLRLAELVDPAVGVLAKEMVSTENKPGDRIRAAENILDRAGYGRQIDNGNVELAKAILLNKLLGMRAEHAASGTEPDHSGAQGAESEVVPGEVLQGPETDDYGLDDLL